MQRKIVLFVVCLLTIAFTNSIWAQQDVTAAQVEKDLEPVLDKDLMISPTASLFIKIRSTPDPYIDYLRQVVSYDKGFTDFRVVSRREGAIKILSMCQLPQANQILVDIYRQISPVLAEITKTIKLMSSPPESLLITQSNMKKARNKLIESLGRAKEASVYSEFLDLYEKSDFVLQTLLESYFEKTTDKSLAELLRKRYNDPNSSFYNKQSISNILSKY